MKIFAAIAAIFVFLLSVQPAIPDFRGNSVAECCGKCDAGVQDEAPLEECNDTNPFQSCCTACPGFITPLSYAHSFINSVSKISRIEEYQMAYFQFSVDVWQPPKLA